MELRDASCKAVAQHYSPGDLAPILLAAARASTLTQPTGKDLDVMFISPAYAQTGGAGDPFTGLLIPMLLMIVIFYFLVIRPQQQRAKEHKEMIAKVRPGDTVVTAGGFIGRVRKAAENSDEIEIELSDTMKVRVLKGTLMDVRSKNEPVKETS